MASNESSLAAGTLFNVDGLVALITGGGSGIGLMITKALVQNGAARVYIAGRRREVLEQAASSLGPNVVPLTCDVTNKNSLREAAETVREQTGYLNLLVANSGVSGPHAKPIAADTTIEDFAARNFDIGFDDYVGTFAVNTAAVWFTAMAFLPLLDAGNRKGNLQQTSHVIVTSSVAGYNKKPTGGWAYGQSKAAVTMLTKQLSVALPQWNIRINAIAPGFFPSDMSASVLSANGAKVDDMPKSAVPLGRMGDEKDMSGTALYLASRAGAYVNGDVLLVDGGRLGLFPSVF
ncbi:Short-chain dehydrogenase [Geosmithia morbida]|uniref:Short-chain dehydrogenase n=1 Tax=Geosmithia morbida TaxID=1094350 RepID=A0A9P5D3N9_9HYPO|nr:Short-chain dehydrogenase [Geosmithia morbida]KAF4122716.1 Short-chain dehydrogenase [Geosmithia morbida]